jgi:hypothetical protein
MIVSLTFFPRSLGGARAWMQAAVIALGVLNRHNNEEITG